MNLNNHMNCGCDRNSNDRGGTPFVINMTRAAMQNQNFRTAMWTGCEVQMTLMCIPMRGEIGLEVHPETEQIIRVESGCGTVMMGRCRDRMEKECRISAGDTVFVPKGTWHNIGNTGDCPLQLSSFCAPPHHPFGTVHRTRADAEHSDC